MVITHQEDFYLYSGRMELKLQGSLKDLDGKPRIVTAEFSLHSDFLFFGTSNGKIISYSVPEGVLQET